MKKALLFLIILFSFFQRETLALNGCPDTPVVGPESLDVFITDANTHQSYSDGMVLPVNTTMKFDAIATAYGECDTEVFQCFPPAPCSCVTGPVYQRSVNKYTVTMDAVTQGGWNGNYTQGNSVCNNSPHVLDTQSPLCTPAPGATLAYPGTYTFNFFNMINMPACLVGLCPNSIMKSATFYAAEQVNDDCNTRTSNGISVASGIAATEEIDFSIQGEMGLTFRRYYDSNTAIKLSRGFGGTWGHTFDTIINTSKAASNLYKVTNPDGSIVLYSDRNGDTVYEAVSPKGETSSLIKNPDNTLKRVFTDVRVEEFNPSGYLTAIVDRNGNRMDLNRDSANNLTTATDPAGRVIAIAYDSSNRINVITLPDGRTINYVYYYNVLQKVIYPDGTNKTYEYIGNYLTGIKNEKGNYIKKYAYDLYNNRVSTASADGTKEKVTINFVDNTHTRVTDSLGRVTTYTIDKMGGKNHATAISGPGCAECGQGAVAYTYDDNLNVISKTDPNGNVTTFTYDANGNMLTKTEAFGMPVQRTTTYTYNQFGQTLTITDPDGNVTTNTYDGKGNLLSTTDSEGHIISYTYDSRGLRTSITDARGNTTNYAYDSYGNLTQVTDPLNHTVSYTYNTMGRVVTMTDMNNNTTIYEYDLRDRIKKVTAADGGITTYEYDLAGNLTAATDPMGNRTVNTYDNINRLTKITDAQNSSMNYTYDSQSNKLSLTIKDSSNAVTMTDAYSYDDYNRLTRTTHADATYSELGYDYNGNVTTRRDENGNSYLQTYDALNRMSTVLDPLSGITAYSYDPRNNLTSITNANGNTTSYAYDNANRLTSTISPDTGLTTNTYDGNGNLLTKTDAGNVTVRYTYDALNRLQNIQFPDTSQNIVYSYDNCPNGNGKLCGITDQSGITSYEYNPKGQITKGTNVIDNFTYVTEYGYDLGGNLLSTTYPGGRVVSYTYQNNKTTGILNNAVPIASAIAYKPFGPMSSLTYGNGFVQTTSYDQRYRITSITNANLQNLSYYYDNNGNITVITNNLDPQMNKTYSYDALNRLATALGPWESLGWTYDGVGNRQTQTNGGLSTYSYQTGTNRLTTITGVMNTTFTIDPNGNTATENTRTFIYNQNQRLIRVVENGTNLGEYVYNGNGQRVKKTTAAGTVVFHYDLKGQLMAESTTSGSITAEYVFLTGNPFAKIESGNIYYYHDDHLGTPMKMTDALGAVVWVGEFRPFGEPYTIIGTITNNLRFPGQHYDEETGLHYNYFREYHPVIARYVETDPFGLEGGKNHMYGYASNNPLIYIDPKGLWSYNGPPSQTGRLSGAALALANCLEKCLGHGQSFVVTGGSECQPDGRHTPTSTALNSRHCTNEAIDVRPNGNRTKTFCCAAKCHAVGLGNEGNPPHWHFQTAGNHYGRPNSCECKKVGVDL